jgi:hypothetical protein
MVNATSIELMMVMPLNTVFFLGSVHLLPPPFVWRALPSCKTLTFWSNDGGTIGITPLLGCIIMEAYAYPFVMVATIVAGKVKV